MAEDIDEIGYREKRLINKGNLHHDVFEEKNRFNKDKFSKFF